MSDLQKNHSYNSSTRTCDECGAHVLDTYPIWCPGKTPEVNRWEIPKCECGSRHTSNPNCHSHWCPMHKKD